MEFSILTRSEVEHDLYIRYGIGIELSKNEHNTTFDMFSLYKFLHTGRVTHKYPEEFTSTLPEILYRNVYWINSPYRMNILYSEIKEELDNEGYIENKESCSIKIKTQDNRVIPFIPKMINKKDKHLFFHYFDMSYFSGRDMKTGELTPYYYMGKILNHFNKSKKDSLAYAIDECYDTLDYR